MLSVQPDSITTPVGILWLRLTPLLTPAGRHDSMEADSIMKSARHADSTLSLGDSESQEAGNIVSDAGTDKAAPVLDQQKAVAGSLDHIAENVVTAVKGDAVTDPEQAFTQGDCHCNGHLTCNVVLSDVWHVGTWSIPCRLHC